METPVKSITIGKFTIMEAPSHLDLPPDQIWIQHESGEGMSCQVSLLESAISDFFDKHF